MGGFLGIGGSSANTDRKYTLAGYNDLSNVFNSALGIGGAQAKTGAATTATGLGGLEQSLNYWQKILGGNRTQVSQAMAPQTAAIQAQSDAAKRQAAAAGTARGGGTSSVEQQRGTQTQALIDQGLLAARPEAAKQVASTGQAISQLGTTETNEALNALGIGETASANLTDISGKNRAIDYQINKSSVGDVLGIVGGAILGGISGGPMGALTGGLSGLMGI